MRKITLAVLLLLFSTAAFAQVPYIVGGRDANPQEFPHQVAIYVDNRFYGGGTILNNEWILTAGHVVAGVPAANVSVRADGTILTNTLQRKAVQSIIYYPGYILGSTGESDVALLRLASPLSFSCSTFPVAYAAPDLASYITVGSPVTVSGWGSTSSGTPSVTRLRAVGVSIVNTPSGYDPGSNLIYTGTNNGGQGACYGDSGGPLVQDIPGVGTTLVGVVSSGPPSCNGTTQYVRVSTKASWIQQVTGVARTQVSGANELCGTAPYALTNLGGGAGVSWTSSAPSILSVNAATGVATAGNVGGRVAVEARRCNGTLIARRYVSVGRPGVDGFTVSNDACSTRTIRFTPQLYDSFGNYSYYWYVQGTGASIRGTANGPSVLVNVGTRYNFRMLLGISNSCGDIESESNTYINGSCGGGSFRTAYPNPAAQEVVLESAAASDETSSDAPAEFEATLYDGLGNPVRQSRSRHGQTRFDVQTLPNGLYYLRSGQGATRQSQTIRVQH